MSGRRLVFLGPSPAAERAPAGGLRHEEESLEPGVALVLLRKRSPWNPKRDTERVIVGSHPARADVLLLGEGIQPEHLRLYLPRRGDGAAELLVIHQASTRLEGRVIEPREWASLAGGEEIDIGPWRFRYESGLD